jgi:hypothetical protein
MTRAGQRMRRMQCEMNQTNRLTTVPLAVPRSVLEQRTRHLARSLADCRSGAFPLHHR